MNNINIKYIDTIDIINLTDISNHKVQVSDNTKNITFFYDKQSNNTDLSFSNKKPNIIIIVPYRDRPEQLYFFTTHMSHILTQYAEQDKVVRVLFCHQVDKRPFNRGAMKNLGYIWSKKTYGEDVANKITFVFHDIDTLPYKKHIMDYDLDTVINKREKNKYQDEIVKHFYGYKFALGGIFSIKGRVFELLGGFPNFWGWGYEDNAFAYKCEIFDIDINYDDFYPILDNKVLFLNNGHKKITTDSNKDYMSLITKNCIDNIKNVHFVERNIDDNFNIEVLKNNVNYVNGNIQFTMIDVLDFSVDNKYTEIIEDNYSGFINVPKYKQKELENIKREIINRKHKELKQQQTQQTQQAQQTQQSQQTNPNNKIPKIEPIKLNNRFGMMFN